MSMRMKYGGGNTYSIRVLSDSIITAYGSTTYNRFAKNELSTGSLVWARKTYYSSSSGIPS